MEIAKGRYIISTLYRYIRRVAGSRALRCALAAFALFFTSATVITCTAGHQAAPFPDGRQKLRNDFLRLKFGLFLHFNMGTFAGREWANGYEDPAIFKPDRLNCEQWAQAARSAGMTYGVLTAKHTEGYCLWDSKYTTHDITSFMNFKNGRGDIVKEYVAAFRKHGLKAGLYYCFPGDYSNPSRHGYAVPEGQPDLHGLPPEAVGDYVGFIKKQLSELLTNYGPIDVLWIDQFRNKYTGGRWPEILAYVHKLQPECIVVANNADDLAVSDVLSFEFPWKPDRLPPDGNTTPAEICDTIQRKTWFWRESQPGELKSAEEVVRMLHFANERHANYLLNVPPDRDGLISGAHLKHMHEIGQRLGVK